MRASVPANLLLLGEYAVLEEGGLGLAVAADPRVRVRLERRTGAGLAVVARMEAELHWSPGSARGDPRTALLEAAVEVCCPEGPPAGTVEVDSSDFFFARAQGRLRLQRRGGDRAVLGPAGPGRGLPPAPAAVLEAALAAHGARRAAGAAATTCWLPFTAAWGCSSAARAPPGGRFTCPGWSPSTCFTASAAFPRLRPSASTASGACRRPEEARRFLEESNRLVQGFARAASRFEALRLLRRCRELGLRLGEAIGVPASLPTPDPAGWDEVRLEDCKALGAGNELALAFPELPPGRAAPRPAAGMPGAARGCRRKGRREPPADAPARGGARQAAALRGARGRARPPGRGAFPVRDHRCRTDPRRAP